MRYIDTHCVLTRGTTAPLVMDLDTDLTDATVTFTMRTSVEAIGDPVVQVDSTDPRMEISGKRIIVTLTDSDTWAVPEKAQRVFIQLNVTQNSVVNATLVYALMVGPNIIQRTEPEPEPEPEEEQQEEE